MKQRVITATILMTLACVLVIFQGWYMRVALAAMAAVSVYEMHSAFAKKGMKAVKWPAYAYCVLSTLAVAFEEHLPFGSEGALFALMLCTMAGLIAVILRGKPDFDGTVATVFPMFYPGLFYTFFQKLQDLSGRGIPTLALTLTILLPAMNDTFALFAGRAFGKHKLIPGISPHKTVEGSVTGICASVVFALATGLLFPVIDGAICGAEGAAKLLPLWAFAALGLVSGVVSQLGDLMASLIKRYCGIKDYGKLFPGHGGMMDRMDAILFNAALCCMFFAAAGY